MTEPVDLLVRARLHGGVALCPYCRDATDGQDFECGCGVVYHDDCRAALSRCATLGCKGTRARPRAAPAPTCARCSDAIRNDGDVCVSCWTPYHRRCLHPRCCPPPVERPALTADPCVLDVPRAARAPGAMPSWKDTLVFTLGVALTLALFGSIANVILAEPTMDFWSWSAARGALGGAVTGFVSAGLGLLLRWAETDDGPSAR